MDWYLISVLVFLGILGIILLIDRKHIERKYILFTRRTKRGKKFLDNVAKLSPKFWKLISSVGVFVCFVGMAFGLYFLIKNLIIISEAPALSLLIPLPVKEAIFGYGYVGIPFWYFIISILFLVLIHEGMHGIIARVEKVRIKSLGLLLLAVIPGAFVEPDEKQLKKKNWKSKLRIYAAGSFGNFILAGIVLLLTTLVVSPLFLSTAVGYAGHVNSTQYGREPYPAQIAGMANPIVSIDGERTESVEDLAKIMDEKKPNDIVRIETTKKNYTLELAENPDNKTKGFIGISGLGSVKVLKEPYRNSPLSGSLIFFIELLGWIFMLNLGVGLVNLFPIKPLDGGLMIETLGEKFAPKYKKGIVMFLSALILSLMVGNFLIGFL